MAKAIHWPKTFREELLNETTTDTFCALRLGSLYFEGRYWVDGEEVDIRCNHLKIRRAVVQGDLKNCRVKDLTPQDFSQLKKSLRTHSEVIRFLTETYQQPVDAETVITAVYYKNLAVIPENVEREEDTSGRHL